jgi:hypothetical protein
VSLQSYRTARKSKCIEPPILRYVTAALPDGVDDADHVPASKAIFTLYAPLIALSGKRAGIWQQSDNKNESGYLERI